MLKKKFFYIALIIIYLLYLTKDTLFGVISNLTILKETSTSEKESYYEQEYNNLSKLLEIKNYDYNIIYTKVLTRNIYDFFNKITIFKGAKDNLEVGDVVINELGLIGLISKVDENTSEVVILTNSNTNLSVKINDSFGILTAKDNTLLVKNIKLNKEIEVGASVYTSGLTQIPEGILIGTVKSVNKDNLELEYLIEITPSVDFYNLNYMGVIKR